MSRFKNIYFALYFTAIIALPFSYFLQGEARARRGLAVQGLALQKSLEVPSVIARVGEYQIRRLTGWTSPFAEVHLNGQGIARKTMADERGYFEFNFAPIKKTFGELCLFSVDVNQTVSRPVCLPPPPLSENIEILDILLAPSISTNGDDFLKSEPAKASGMTFPKSEVDIRLFSCKGRPCTARPPLANPPPYKIQSNSNGYFEFSLPTARVSQNRLFAVSVFPFNLQADIKSAPTADLWESAGNPRESQLFSSPKSNTLTFSVFKIPFWLLFFLLLLLLLLLLRRKKSRALLIPETNLVKSPSYCETEIFSGPKVLRI